MPLDQALIEEATGWRRHLHSLPETGFEEVRTSEFVAGKLASFGMDVHRGLGGTGVVGTLRRGSANRAIGLRADMDALNIVEANGFAHRSQVQGKMHACGHDGHTAMLLGAAKLMAAEGRFDGTLHVFFQPAEEHGCGAQAMVDDGLLQRFPVEAVFGLHNAPFLPVGTFATRVGGLMASEDDFEITIKGLGGHAARPNRVIDPVVIAGEIIVALQSVVSRSVDPMQHAVVSITEILTDGTRNVIPNTVTLKGDTRSFSGEVQATIEAAMRRIVAGLCAAHGADHSFAYTHEFQPTINTASATAAALGAARDVFDQVDGDCTAVMGSEDFANMIKACGEGNFGFIGNAGPGKGDGVNLHNPHYDFNDEALPYGIRYWAALVAQQLPARA